MKNKIEDLRNHLFMALEGLADTEKPLDIERAKAIADVAQVLINSAKVEVDFLRQTGYAPVGGLLQLEDLQAKPEPGTVTRDWVKR